MRVICIQPIDSTAKGLEQAPRPSVGDEDTVWRQYDNHGYIYYVLMRYPYGYRADCFATLPSATDEQAIEAEQEAIIYQR